MPPKKTSDGSAAPTGLNENELRFIKAIFDNMTQKPDADWTKVATDLGLKDAKCAKERFRQMSVRHGWREQGGSSGGTPRKGKAGAASADAKVSKKPRTPKKKAKKEEASDDEGMKQESEDEVKSEDEDTMGDS